MDNLIVEPNHRLIAGARKLALASHEKHLHGDMSYGEFHLTAVAGLVACFTKDPEVIAAAWLHDVVEDCIEDGIDLEVVEKMTTARTAHLVDLLTDPPGKNRKERKALSMPRIAVDREASLIKGADRFHNHASTIMDNSVRFAGLYFKEFDHFMDTLKLIPTPLRDMLSIQRPHLESLAP